MVATTSRKPYWSTRQAMTCGISYPVLHPVLGFRMRYDWPSSHQYGFALIICETNSTNPLSTACLSRIANTVLISDEKLYPINKYIGNDFMFFTKLTLLNSSSSLLTIQAKFQLFVPIIEQYEPVEQEISCTNKLTLAIPVIDLEIWFIWCLRGFTNAAVLVWLSYLKHCNAGKTFWNRIIWPNLAAYIGRRARKNLMKSAIVSCYTYLHCVIHVSKALTWASFFSHYFHIFTYDVANYLYGH